MVIHQDASFHISPKSQWFRWFTLLGLFISTVFIPFKIATAGQLYPDLNILLIFYSGAGFLWIMIVVEYGRQTTAIQFESDHFTVKKFLQRPERFKYSDITGHNERKEIARVGSFHMLTVYLATSYFSIKSIEYPEYEQLKEYLCSYGKPVSYIKAMTLAERNRIRWLTAGLTVLIAATIAFGYIAHNPIDTRSAQLVSITDVVNRVHASRNKSRLTGVTISLRAFPDFSFFVSQKNYDTRLDNLASAIQPKRPVTLLLRQSDFRKKLVKTEPLTFGDKYVSFKEIMVYGVDQGNVVRLLTPRQVYEPPHTNPIQRTCLLSILLLFCWTGWVYIDRHTVIGAD